MAKTLNTTHFNYHSFTHKVEKKPLVLFLPTTNDYQFKIFWEWNLFINWTIGSRSFEQKYLLWATTAKAIIIHRSGAFSENVWWKALKFPCFVLFKESKTWMKVYKEALWHLGVVWKETMTLTMKFCSTAPAPETQCQIVPPSISTQTRVKRLFEPSLVSLFTFK